MLPVLLFVAALAGDPTPTATAGLAGQSQPTPSVLVSPIDPPPTKAPTPIIATKDAYITSKPAQDKVICRSYEDTGTRLGGSRRCLKASEWAIRDSGFKRELSSRLNAMTQGPAGP